MQEMLDVRFEQRCAELQERLQDVCARRHVSEAWIGVVDRRCTQTAAVTQRGRPSAPFDIEAACLAKVITATLIAQLVKDDRLCFEDHVLRYVASDNPAARKALAGVSVAHLLNHTHGLDGSSLHGAPLSPRGLIDIDDLCYELRATEPLAAPGRMYCYSNVGAFLAAALLETVHRRGYAEVLVEQVLQPIGATLRFSDGAAVQHAPAPSICPATGSGLLLSAVDIIAFLKHHLGVDDEFAVSEPLQPVPFKTMFESVAPLPGWSPIEKGIAIGWKYYGAGWFGHNANFSDATVQLRLHPEQRRAIVIAARAPKADAAFPILESVLGDLLPDLVTFRLPKLLTEQEGRSIDAQRMAGVYENSAHTVSIEQRHGALHVIAKGVAEGVSVPRGATMKRLRPAETGIFFPEPADLDLFPFLQFVCPGSSEHFQYIWNGRHLWKWQGAREDATAV